MENFWEKEGWELEDKHLKQLSEAPFVRSFPDLDLRDGIFIIRGPRQVGKSSWLKTLLSSLTKSRKSVFYLSCENIRDQYELSLLLKSLRGTEYILLDEVTFIKDWALAVKHEADGNHLQTLIITGSNAYDLSRGGERLPGRLGNGKELELLPMSFPEFEKMHEVANWKKISREEALLRYFRIGGFPGALIEAGEEGREPKKI